MSSYSIVIIGGGAGGLELAVALARDGHSDILLVDKSPTHVWKPRLHEMAVGRKAGDVDEIAYAALADKWGFSFQLGELADVAPDERAVILAPMHDSKGREIVPARRIGYRALVLAIGGATPDFGVEGVREHATMLDHGRDAKALQSRISRQMLAHRTVARDRPLKIVIAGSGATGVELAAHLKDGFQCDALAPQSTLPDIEVTILEGADQILPGVDSEVRSGVQARLAEAGVVVETGEQICKVAPGEVQTTSGNTYVADLTVWATGTAGPAVSKRIEALDTNEKNQWIVRPTLQTTASDAVFAIGDCCAVQGSPAPTTAQAASEQAAHLAENLPRWLNGDAPADFEFHKKGTLLSLGDAGAVGGVKSWFDDDIFINGRMARAAYQGLYRQHQFRILGVVKGTEEVLADMFERAVGPRLKVHG